MRTSEKRNVITSVRWTEEEFCRLHLYLYSVGRDNLSDLIREVMQDYLETVLRSYDKTKESNNERKERSKEKKETTKKSLADSEIGAEAEASTHHKKEKSLAERRQEFWNRLVPYVQKGVYTRDMVTAFYYYWTESNENGKKMRFEMEKTYELPRRLATWQRRETRVKSRGSRGESPGTRGGSLGSRVMSRETQGLVVEQLRAKQLREKQSAEYLRHQEEAQQQAISYAEYKKLQSETSNQQSLQQ